MVWSQEGIELSDRLKTIAEKIDPGESCADIGTDHGYLGIYLYQKGISPFVVFTDISEASLSKAKASAGAHQFGNDLSFRTGDGLSVLEPAEVDCVVIAGMGGRLIRDIMAEDVDKTNSFRRFVLQPRTASGPLRKWLLQAGFSFLSEDIVVEGDHLPEIITVAPEGSRASDEDFDYFDRKAGMDLAAGIRNTLLGSEEPDSTEQMSFDPYGDHIHEDSVLFSVPIWMMNAGGPVIEFIERKLNTEKNILQGMSKAASPDNNAMETVRFNIDYLEQMLQLRKLREKHIERTKTEQTKE